MDAGAIAAVIVSTAQTPKFLYSFRTDIDHAAESNIKPQSIRLVLMSYILAASLYKQGRAGFEFCNHLNGNDPGTLILRRISA